MADFKVDENGDLDFSEGLQLVEGEEELVTRLNLGLSVNLNEFFTHINHGIPWIKSGDNFNDVLFFLGGDIGVSAAYIADTLTKYIESIEGVISVENSYSLNRAARVLTYTPVIEGEEGVINFPPYTLEL